MSQERKSRGDVEWLDILKGIALLWIFLNHVAERVFGYPHIANPVHGWAPFDERVSQLEPLAHDTVWGWALNALRYVGWSGDQGVQLFLIASGFGLTYGLLSRGAERIQVRDFFERRAARVYPLWIIAHILVLVPFVLLGRASALDPRIPLSMMGIRVTASSLYFIDAAWWYIGLLLQLYLVFPLLWSSLRRWGPGGFLLLTAGVAFLIRGAGLFYFDAYLDAWSRGAIFLTRLPEFAFGMALAHWWKSDPSGTARRLSTLSASTASLFVYALGIACALTLGGMTFAPALLGVGAFGLLMRPLVAIGGSTGLTGRTLRWVGKHSFSLFLVHNLAVGVAVSSGSAQTPVRLVSGVLAAVALTLLAGLAFERLEAVLSPRVVDWSVRQGFLRVVAKMATVAFLSFGLALGAETYIRKVNPQEALGWGERPSLMPDSTFGWKLIPGQTTRLRWEGYDYTITANSLGFPAPEYPVGRDSGTIRILVTGDAFTSAEGVDPEVSWPRVLEGILNGKSGKPRFQVMNFAITGYGPAQYDPVIRTFVPVFKPDIVMVEMFVNEFQDVMVSTHSFQSSIGFRLPAQDGIRSYIQLSHLQTYMSQKLVGPVVSRIQGKPSPAFGYFLGNIESLRKGGPSEESAAVARVNRALVNIKSVTDSVGARLVVLLVPASVQVCTPSSLEYFPANVDLTDTSTYNRELPQQQLLLLANRLGVPAFDLRECLAAGGSECYYHPRNMHWLPQGHAVVARYIADRVIAR